MAEIAAPVIESTVTDDEFGGFRITIPARKRVQRAFAIVFAIWGLVLGLALWATVTSPRPMTDEGIKFFGFWAVVGAFLGFVAASTRITREVIIIEGKQLVFRKELAGLSRTRTFDLAALRNLRPMQSHDEYHARRRPDAVAFDHNGRTYRFGHRLSEQEVMRLIKTIRSKYPIRDAWDDAEPLPVIT